MEHHLAAVAAAILLYSLAVRFIPVLREMVSEETHQTRNRRDDGGAHEPFVCPFVALMAFPQTAKWLSGSCSLWSMEYNNPGVIDFTPSKVRSMETMIVEREQALSLVHELLAQLVPGAK
jgi:hypothetical protein